MWDKAVTWLLALLALASSAGWLASRRTRSLRRLKAESDLLVNLPAGKARTALVEHIEASVESYLRERDARDRARAWILGTGLAQMLAVVLLVVAEFGGAGINDDWDASPVWAVCSALTGLALIFGSAIVEIVIMLRGSLASMVGEPRQRPALRKRTRRGG